MHDTIWKLALFSALAIWVCLISPNIADAQRTPRVDQAPPAQRDVQSETSDLIKQFTIPAETLLSITKPAQEIADSMARVNDLLKGNVESIRNAEQEIERMLKMVEEAGAASSPSGDFVKRVEDLISIAQGEAQIARNRGSARDVELQKEYEKYAIYFAESKKKAIEYHGGHFRMLRALREEKERLVQGLKLQQFGLARHNVEEGLKLVEKAYNDLKSVSTSLPPGVGVAQ